MFKAEETKRELKKQKRLQKQQLYAELARLRDNVQQVNHSEAETSSESDVAVVENILSCALRFKWNTLPWAVKVLGVPATADKVTVRRVFRQRLLMVHPDQNKHPLSRQAFEDLQLAYSLVCRTLFGVTF